jgi:hypothetical protein
MSVPSSTFHNSLILWSLSAMVPEDSRTNRLKAVGIRPTCPKNLLARVRAGMSVPDGAGARLGVEHAMARPGADQIEGQFQSPGRRTFGPYPRHHAVRPVDPRGRDLSRGRGGRAARRADHLPGLPIGTPAPPSRRGRARRAGRPGTRSSWVSLSKRWARPAAPAGGAWEAVAGGGFLDAPEREAGSERAAGLAGRLPGGAGSCGEIGGRT